MSDFTRQLSSLVVPSTQNTAPVLEFRCLYSHDVRRKSKRWQDGFLRFHTFNKRVMVYDVPRNFIGDTHWREEDSVQDGDELELERGVLIQVGEALGSVHQDLTAILEKRKPAKEAFSSRISSPYASSSHAVSPSRISLSQMRPKTLNAVLGTPRGAYGRAILPHKSPYQERHRAIIGSQDVENEQPAKRQKLNTEILKNSNVLTEVSIGTKASTRPVIQFSKTLKEYNLPQRKTSYKGRELVSLTYDDEKQSASNRSIVRAKTLKSSKQPKGKSKDAFRFSKGPSLPSERDKNYDRSSRMQVDLSDDSPTAHQALIVPRAPQIQKVDYERPANPLGFASSKLRKKLLYKDLLPQRPPSKTSLDDDGNHQACVSESMTITAFSSPHRPHSHNKLQKTRLEEQTRTRPEKAKSEGRDESELQQDVQLSDSKNLPEENLALREENSLFLTQSTVRDFLEDSRQEIGIDTDVDSEASDAYGLLEMDQLLLSRRPSNPSPSLSNTHNHPKDMNFQNSGTGAKSPDPQNKSATHITTRKSAEAHAPLLPVSHPAIPAPETRSHPVFLPQPQSSTRQRSPLKKSLSENDRAPKPPLLPPPPKKLLQRAISDITSLRGESDQKGPPRNAIANVEKKDPDIGPWSREAFDLFGWRVGDDKKGGARKGVS